MTAEQSQQNAVVSNRQLARNVAANYASFFVAAAIGLVATPIIVRHLGVSTYGVLGVLEATIAYLGLFEAGVATATVQRVAALRAVGDVERLRLTLATARFFNALSSIFVTVSAISLALVLRAFVHFDGLSARPAQVALVVLGLGTAIGMSSLTASAVMLGGGRADRSELLGLLLSTSMRIVQVIVVLRGGGLVGLCLTITLSTVISTFASIILSRRTFPELRISSWRFSRTEARGLLHVGLRNATLAVAGTMSYGIDNIVLGAIRSASEVTPYMLAGRLVRLVRNVATSGTTTLMPRIAHQHAQGDLDAGYRSYAAGLFVVLAIALPLEVVFLVFGFPLLRIWLGTVPPRTYSVLAGFLLLTFSQLPGAQSSNVLVAMQSQKIIARLAIPVALLNVGLSIIATRRYGPLGPVLGSLPQAVVVEAVMYPVMACRGLAVSARRLARDVVLPVAVIGVLSLSLAYLLRVVTDQGSEIVVLLDVCAALAFGYLVAIGVAVAAWPDMATFVRQLARRS